VTKSHLAVVEDDEDDEDEDEDDDVAAGIILGSSVFNFLIAFSSFEVFFRRACIE
jgi:hypothetical protein